MLKQKISKILEKNPNITALKLAKQLEISEFEAFSYLPNTLVKTINSIFFDEIIAEVCTWGKVLMIKVTSSFIIEIKDNFPMGTYSYGYYNLDSKNSSISGHLKVDDIKNISFISKMHNGSKNHNITFFDKKGEVIFKIFICKDDNKEFIPSQLEAYMALRERF